MTESELSELIEGVIRKSAESKESNPVCGIREVRTPNGVYYEIKAGKFVFWTGREGAENYLTAVKKKLESHEEK